MNIAKLEQVRNQQITQDRNRNDSDHPPSRLLLQTDAAYIEAMPLAIGADRYDYLVAAIQHSAFERQLNSTLFVVFCVLAISALLLLPVGFWFLAAIFK